MIKKLLDKLTTEDEKQIVLLDPSALGKSAAEPDLRIIGMFCDVHEEKVAEIIHAMLYLNEMNKLEKKEEDKKPIEFYLSTYGGSADDMFALYDIMRTVRQDSEIHTLGLGKVMSAGVLLLAGGTKGKRRIAKNCRVMIHSVAAGNHGNLQDLTNELGAISDLQEMYTNALSAETNMTPSDIKEMLDRNVNVYLSAVEAVKLGIADIIVQLGNKMSDLQKILKEEYIKQVSQLDLKTLLEMVEDVLSEPAVVVEDKTPSLIGASDQETLEMVLKMIPNIEVSEIGWSDVSTTEEGEAISGPQRALLEDYLNNIKGTTFEERIDNVGMFYAEGAGIIAQGSDQSRTGRITQAISYLVFYKTLTKVITNFNASSAGFSFESFLSALVKGQQIQTGNKTIADYTDNLSGEEIPVSLKLYREGGLEVGGSYTDLVNDLVDPKFQFPGMRYVVCTKDLSGKDLEQEGVINFWQFDFTLDNVMWILANSKEKSAACIRIPAEVVSKIEGKGAEASTEQFTNMLGLPDKALIPSADELQQALYVPKFKQHLAAIRNDPSRASKNTRGLLNYVLRSEREVMQLLNDLSWDSNDALFLNTPDKKIKHEDTGETEIIPGGKVRGRAPMAANPVKNFARAWVQNLVDNLGKDPAKNPELYKMLTQTPEGKKLKKSEQNKMLNSLIYDLAIVIQGANNNMVVFKKDEKKPENYDPRTDDRAGVLGVLRASEIDAERRAMISGILDAEGGFLTPEQSAQFYASQDDRYKKIILEHTLGYLTTMHFSLNQAQATNSAPPGPNRVQPAPTAKDPRATKTVAGGTGAIDLGQIKVGAKYVAEAMDGVRDILNEEILEIFRSLKDLSDNLNKFFAGGLKNDSLASSAVGNANNITSKEVLGGSGFSSSQRTSPRSQAMGGAQVDYGSFNENKNNKQP